MRKKRNGDFFKKSKYDNGGFFFEGMAELEIQKKLDFA